MKLEEFTKQRGIKQYRERLRNKLEIREECQNIDTE
jgi:hypothetical protein